MKKTLILFTIPLFALFAIDFTMTEQGLFTEKQIQPSPNPAPAPAPEPTKPIVNISNIHIDDITDHSATIKWSGNPNAQVWIYVHEPRNITGAKHNGTNNQYIYPSLSSSNGFTIYVQGIGSDIILSKDFKTKQYNTSEQPEIEPTLPTPQPISTPTPSPNTKSSYLETVNLPKCDIRNPEVQLIKTNSDWAYINNKNKSIFCISPGDYTSLGAIKITTLGTKDKKRYIILNNGNNHHPAKLLNSAVAQYQLRISASYWIIDRPTMRNKASESGQMISFERGSSYCIVDRMHTFETNSAILIKGDTSHHTIQRAYFEDMRLSSRKRDVVAIHISDYTDNTVATHHKFLDIDGKNQCDVIHVSKSSTRSDGSKQDVNVEGMIIDGGRYWLTPDVYTDGKGNHKTTGQYSYAEGAIDLKGGAENINYPVVVSNNIFWGWRKSDGTNSSLSNPGGSGTHLGTKNIHVIKNVFFDSSAGWATGDPRRFRKDFRNGKLNDNIFLDMGQLAYGSSYTFSITQTDNVEVLRNTIINPRSASGGHSSPDLYYARFVEADNTTYNDNIIVGATSPLETRNSKGVNNWTNGNKKYQTRSEANLIHDFTFQYERYTNSPKTKVLENILSTPQE